MVRRVRREPAKRLMPLASVATGVRVRAGTTKTTTWTSPWKKSRSFVGARAPGGLEGFVGLELRAGAAELRDHACIRV